MTDVTHEKSLIMNMLISDYTYRKNSLKFCLNKVVTVGTYLKAHHEYVKHNSARLK